jgi:hypothetical protein
MNPQPGGRPVKVGSPAAVLAVVPHLLGFVPSKSLVVIGAAKPRGRIVVTFRFDLPDPPAPDATAAIAAHTAAVLAQNQASTALVIGYGPGPLVTPLADAIREALPRNGLELRDVLRVEAGRYWSYVCHEPSCCSPEGVPFDHTSHPASAALGASGQPILADRDALAATVAPVTGAVADAMRKATSRAERIVAAMSHTAEAGTPGRRGVTESGLKAVRGAIGTYRDGRSIELSGHLAWLALVLTSLRVRDDAWARMDPVHREPHTRLWTDLTRHAQPGYVAAPASLLAFTAWQSGNGALANVALDRALADNPGYSLAQLLRDVVDAGAPPSMAILPMTPEQVAASYDRQADDEPIQGEPAPEQVPAPDPDSNS